MISVNNGLQRKCQKNGVPNGGWRSGGIPPKILFLLIIDQPCHVTYQNDQCDSVS